MFCVHYMVRKCPFVPISPLMLDKIYFVIFVLIIFIQGEVMLYIWRSMGKPVLGYVQITLHFGKYFLN